MNYSEKGKFFTQYTEEKYDAILPVIPPGIYEPEDVGGMFRTIYRYERVQPLDRLIDFENGSIREFISMIATFLSDRTQRVYQEMGMAHKIGTIIYGPHGTGKTCAANLLMNRLVRDYNAICLVSTKKDPRFILNVVESIRKHQQNPIVIFYDEVDSAIRAREEHFLNFLDGTDSVNNCIFIGCTNYPQRIPARIIDRPSRIKHKIEIRSFPSEVYNEFILGKYPQIKPEDLSKLSFLATDNELTLDQLKHVLLDFRLEGVPFEKAIKIAKDTIVYEKSDDDDDD